MRFPSVLVAAVAGLWQQPLVSEKESVTMTRHIHITKTVVNPASTIYAVCKGTATLYMEYLPATLKTIPVPAQTLQATHLELRAEEHSTMHVKVTRTVDQIQSTVFASKIGTSISTITNAPQSLIEEAAEDAAELSSKQLAAAVSSANADKLTHSTVDLLASTGLASTPEPSASSSPTQSEPAQFTNSGSSSSSSALMAVSSSSHDSSETMVPIGLELRGNTATITSDQPQTTTTEAPTTVMVVLVGSSTSTMMSIPATLQRSSDSSHTSATAASSTYRQLTSSERSTQMTQTVSTPVAVDTNAAEVKSKQTALVQASTYSDEASATVSTATLTTTAVSSATACLEGCSTHVPSTIFSTSGSSSTTSNRVYTFPVTMTEASSTSSAGSTLVPSAAQTSDAANILTSYVSQSSASTSADIAADNAAGASGGDSGSFKLSKSGFAAIISVVSIGVGLGSMSQSSLPEHLRQKANNTPVIFLVLFVVAKRRQWKVRQSIVRASRRLTGRFSSHPNKTALRSEKEPTLPIIEPRQPLGPRPAPSSRRHEGFANIDATLRSSYRGVEIVGRSASRGPEAWRKAMASQSQRKKPELRVDTNAAARVEEGRRGQQALKKKGDWKELFRAL